MSEMNLLKDYCDYLVETQPEFDVSTLIEETASLSGLVGVHRTARRRGWLVAVAAAAFVLLLVGGVGLLATSDQPEEAPAVDQVEPEEPPVVNQTEPDEPAVEEPVETEEPPPTSSSEYEGPLVTRDIPPGIESGTLQTPLGTATWVHLTGEEGLFPGGEDAMAWQSGFAISDWESPDSIWVSADGIEWRSEPLPVVSSAELAFPTVVDGVYWLTSIDPAGIWRSTDGTNWYEYDMSGIPGRNSETRFETPVSGGDVSLTSVSFWVEFPLRVDDFYFGADVDTCVLVCQEDQTPPEDACGGGPVREIRPGVAQFGDAADEQCPNPPVIRFEETERGLRVLDDATSADLGEIGGADLEWLTNTISSGEPVFFFDMKEPYPETNFYVLGEQEITVVEVPWTGVGPMVTLFGAEEWIYAYVTDSTAAPMSVWRTSDGNSWTDIGPPSIDIPADGSFSTVAGSLLIRSAQGTWETTDGLNWNPLLTPPEPENTRSVRDPERLESGWFTSDQTIEKEKSGDESGVAWWMYVSETWVSLETLGMEQAGCFTSASAVGPTTFFTGRCLTEGQVDMWILSLDPSEWPSN